MKILAISILFISTASSAGVLSDLWNGNKDYDMKDDNVIKIIEVTKPQARCTLGQDCRWTPQKHKPKVFQIYNTKDKDE